MIFCSQYHGANLREYLRTELTSPLQADGCYWASFYISLWDPSGYSINKLGLLFTTDDQYASEDTPLITAYPQVENYGNHFYDDTGRWMLVSGIYQAVGGERYITIGNFRPDSETDTLVRIPGGSSCAYYVDDVSVIPINDVEALPLAGPDTTFIPGDSVWIGTLTGNLPAVRWYDAQGAQIAEGIPGLWVQPSASTFYAVEATICGKVFRDTVQVSVGLGVGEIPGESIALGVRPNPTGGEINISLPVRDSEWDIVVTNVQGQTICATHQSGGGEFEMHISGPDGIYFVYVERKQTGERAVRKVELRR